MRVSLNKSDLETDAGKHLLEMTVRIVTDGKLELSEIIELQKWLRANHNNESIPAVAYLIEIMTRIAGDLVIDRDELLELHRAVERVIPSAERAPVIKARKAREAARRDRVKELRRIEREKEKEERKRIREADYAKRMRIRHAYANVSGVTFPNEDGSERQEIAKRCKPGEQLILRHDADNAYSEVAFQVLRTNGEQLGYAPEYLAERIMNEIEDGYNVIGVLTDVTGGTPDKPNIGMNFAVFFIVKDVSNAELQQYANGVLSDRS